MPKRFREERGGGLDTLWYMAGPDDYVLHCPPHVERIRIATVVARNETGSGEVRKTLKIVAHPDSPIHFETSERVEVDVTGSHRGDIMLGPKYGSATFRGGAGNDELRAIATLTSSRHAFYGGAGNDTLSGGPGKDTLDGGTGDDVIFGRGNNNRIYGGHGNDRIVDGDGASIIHTGPGRNVVSLGDGDDVVHVGAGVNRIDAGTGAVVFHVAYGGVTVIRRWGAAMRLNLGGWPALPEITPLGAGRVQLRLALSVIDLHGVRDPAAVAAQIDGPEPPPAPKRKKRDKAA